MNTQFYLDEFDIQLLVKLMLRSQQFRTREALCLRIGIDPRRLGFIKDSADADFVLQLITYLNEVGNKEALCKLCCLELIPIFSQSEKYAPILSEIAAKLHCNQVLTQNKPNNEQPTSSSSIPGSRVSVNPLNKLVKNKLITGSTILLIGLAGFNLFNQNKNSNSPSTHHLLEATDPKGIAILGKQGQTVTIKASGKVNTRQDGTVRDCDKWTGPNGILECRYVGKDILPLPYKNEPFMALIGEFENEPAFVVGNMYKYKFKKTGNLLLRINDSNYADSAGAFRIETTITN